MEKQPKSGGGDQTFDVEQTGLDRNQAVARTTNVKQGEPKKHFPENAGHAWENVPGVEHGEVPHDYTWV